METMRDMASEKRAEAALNSSALVGGGALVVNPRRLAREAAMRHQAARFSEAVTVGLHTSSRPADANCSLNESGELHHGRAARMARAA
jgi:hypothetical protein